MMNKWQFSTKTGCCAVPCVFHGCAVVKQEQPFSISPGLPAPLPNRLVTVDCGVERYGTTQDFVYCQLLHCKVYIHFFLLGLKYGNILVSMQMSTHFSFCLCFQRESAWYTNERNEAKQGSVLGKTPDPA